MDHFELLSPTNLDHILNGALSNGHRGQYTLNIHIYIVYVPIKGCYCKKKKKKLSDWPVIKQRSKRGIFYWNIKSI